MMLCMTDCYVVLALSIASAVAWCGMVQYSRFVSNQKELKTAALEGTESDKLTVDAAIGGKFWIGYVAIPLLFAVLSAFGMIYLADILAVRGILSGEQEIALASIVGSVLIYCALDRWLVSNLGDAAFFKKVEESVIDRFLSSGALPADKEANPEFARLIAAGFSEAEAQQMLEAKKETKR